MLNENHLIKDNIKNLRLLTESVDQKSIEDAINTNNIVYIYYQGDNTTDKGFRTIEPYALGKHTGTTNQLLRAYQQAGKTDTPHRKYVKGGPLANRGGWRLFDVTGISQWMPVTGDKSKFVVKRDEFRLNDKALKDISAQHSNIEIPMNVSSGESSIDQTNFTSTQNPSIDVENDEFQYKKMITFLFGKEKFSGKRNPANSSVVRNKNGELYNHHNRTLRQEIENGTINRNDVIGNLDELFKDVSGLQDTLRIAKPAFEKYQNDLNNSASLLGGEHSRPIKSTFLQDKAKEFLKN